MNKYNLELTRDELKILEILLQFSLFEIMRNFKKFGSADYDLKECYWNYRQTCNRIREKIKKLN